MLDDFEVFVIKKLDDDGERTVFLKNGDKIESEIDEEEVLKFVEVVEYFIKKAKVVGRYRGKRIKIDQSPLTIHGDPETIIVNLRGNTISIYLYPFAKFSIVRCIDLKDPYEFKEALKMEVMEN